MDLLLVLRSCQANISDSQALGELDLNCNIARLSNGDPVEARINSKIENDDYLPKFKSLRSTPSLPTYNKFIINYLLIVNILNYMSASAEFD